MFCWLCGFETTELATNANAPMCKNGASSCPTCTAVAKVDEEVNQAVATLLRLLAKRSDLRSEQNRAHDPMHRLPVELRSRTFELVQPEWDDWGEPLVEGVPPSFLSSICRSWRDIAWANPALWSTIRMEPTKVTAPWWIDFVHNRILRSGTLPLTFSIEITDVSGQDIEDWLTKLLDTVLGAMSQCSNRLQSLSLNIPFSTFGAFRHSNFQWHHLTRLRIIVESSQYQSNKPLSLFNPTASPESIELYFLSFKSLQISWNRLSYATVQGFDLEDLTRLFQHASQMTDCHVYSLQHGPENFAMPPIIHHRLKTLSLRHGDWRATPIIGSLTLPCLQEFTSEMFLVIDLPALVQRSSCPLTKLTLHYPFEGELVLFDNLQPLLGVKDVFVDYLSGSTAVIKKLLLGGYFPDLRHLSLLRPLFLRLWEMGIIPRLLNCIRFQPDEPNERRLPRLLVKGIAPDFWNSKIGEEVKALGVSLREDGFEVL